MSEFHAYVAVEIRLLDGANFYLTEIYAATGIGHSAPQFITVFSTVTSYT